MSDQTKDNSDVRAPEALTLAISLPTDGSGQATLSGRGNGVGIVRQVQFSSPEELGQILYDAAADIFGLELDPPIVPVSAEE